MKKLNTENKREIESGVFTFNSKQMSAIKQHINEFGVIENADNFIFIFNIFDELIRVESHRDVEKILFEIEHKSEGIE